MYLVVMLVVLMYLDVYKRDPHQDTIRIHAGYIKIHQDTYPVAGCINHAHDLACIMSICEAEQLSTQTQLSC
jgi:hypothetical protein